MDYAEFSELAEEIFAGVPEQYREGIDGLEVSRATKPHPRLEEIFTLGECLTESYPSEYGGAGEVRSRIVLYYGSFVALARSEEEFDWEAEVFETITHELRHHLESLATEDALEQVDYVLDQNYARRAGEEFDPLFYRGGERIGDHVWEVDEDRFIEVPIPRGLLPGDAVRFPWRRGELELPIPADWADITFITLDRTTRQGGEVVVVLVRRTGWLETITRWVRREPLSVARTTARV